MLCAVSPLPKSMAKPSLRKETPVLGNPGLSALAELYLFTQKHPVDRAREVRASPHTPPGMPAHQKSLPHSSPCPEIMI